MLENKPNHRIQNQNRGIAGLCVIIFLCSLLVSVWMWRQTDVTGYDNELRLRINRDSGKYPRMEFDLAGKITYADQEFSLEAGKKVNVQEMLQRDRFSKKSYPGMEKIVFTLENEGRVNGFLVYLVPEEEISGENEKGRMLFCGIPFLLGVLVTTGIFLHRLFVTNRRVLRPMEEISTSASKIIHGDYDYEVVRVYGTKLREDEIGTLIYSFEMMRDELKAGRKKEAEIKKSQQELISCISHDLKTPLSTIKAYAEGLHDGMAKSEESRKRFTEIILTKTDLIIGMTEELLKFSNAELNKLSIIKTEVYFKGFFEKLMQEMKLYVENAGISFSSACHLEDCLVPMDEKRIGEVLYNLVENSMKYRGEQNPEISIDAYYEGDKIRICVKDNGIGIQAADIPYVFDKFYRAEKSRSGSTPGSGLGLSICKYIVEQHGGEISCSSRKGEGCEMNFSLRLQG